MKSYFLQLCNLVCFSVCDFLESVSMKKKMFLVLLPIWVNSVRSKEYFQQEVNYIINVKLDDVKHELHGDISIEYINNSLDELSFIWFHLWPNAYKNNHTALAKQLIDEGNRGFYFASEEERGWIDGLDFKVNGQSVRMEYHPEHIDICKIILNAPLKPGERITITTPFLVHIPIGKFSRLGHIGQQYQITQWYPKPAVYDKYGWHPMPYLNQGEFYSEWGSFDVFITLPKNYVVGATGDYVNGEEEIAWLNKKAEEAKTLEKFPYNTEFPPSSTELKTLHLRQTNVHDFAWFADKRYYVVKDEVELPYSKRKVTTWGMFTGPEGELWQKSAKYVADAIYYYSLWNGDYPYSHATAVDGALSAGGGMEYPNVTVIGKMSDAHSLDRVIAHEVGHNWFYGILGSNERDHAWMDEGINSFNEARYMNAKYPKDSITLVADRKKISPNIDIGKLLGLKNIEENIFDLGYRFQAAQKKDQPCDLPSAEYTSINYGIIVYGKTAMLFEYLRAYLGTELFDRCAKEYFERWKFKHPYPEDIKKVYEEVSGKDLSWFFNELISTTGKVDYKICSVKKSQCSANPNGHCWEVEVKNKGEINAPFSISAIKNGKVVSTDWFDAKSRVNKVYVSATDFDHVKIDAGHKMPEFNRHNNTFKMRGICKRTEPFQLKMLGPLHNPYKTQLFWIPVTGWNKYNKLMVGAAVYNNLLPEKKLEWHVMPLYAIGNNELAGSAAIHYNMHFDRIFQTVRFGVSGKRYSYSNEPLEQLNFYKVQPELMLELRKKRLNSSIRQIIQTRHVNITKEVAVGDFSFSPPLLHYDSNYVSINDFTYVFGNNRKINPYSISLNIQQEISFVKSSLTANYHVTFRKRKKGLNIRLFIGKFLDNEFLSDGNYYFHSSGRMGSHDYLYDYTFLGRNEGNGFFSRQFADMEGNMKVYTPLGRTRDWMGALNLDLTLPGKLPVSLYSDVVTFSKDSLSTIGQFKQYTLFNAGLHIALVKNIIDVYVPLLMSKDIKNTFYINNSDLVPLGQTTYSDPNPLKRTMRMIRFTFNIHNLNPFDIVRNLDL